MKKITSPFLLIKKSWEMFSTRENLVPLVQIYVPLGIVSLISLMFLYVPFLSKILESPQGDVVTNLLNILFAFVFIFVNLAGIIAFFKISDGGKAQVRKVYAEAFAKFWKYFLLICLTGLIYAVGFALLIFPFVMFWTWFTFSSFVFVEKGFGVKATLAESKKMVKGIFWKVFTRILVFGCFSICSYIVLAFIPYGAGDIVFRLSGALFLLPYFLLYKEVLERKSASE